MTANVRILTVMPALREDVRRTLRILLSQTIRPELIIVIAGSRILEEFLLKTLATWKDFLRK